MSNGVYLNSQLTITGKEPLSMPINESRSLKWEDKYDLRTVDQHIAQLERDIARLQQLVADQGMMIAQLREIVQGEPPFLAPEGNWTLNE